MRKCFRCGATMKEGFRIEVNRSGGGLDLVSGGALFFKKIGTPKAAVCLSCGEVSLYIDLIAEEKESYAYVEKQKPVLADASFQTITEKQDR